MTEPVSLQKEHARVQPPLAAPVVQHAEPKEGGSYTRNINTGALVKSELAPVHQPDQE
ncbi:MAG: hypothetical protein WA191_20775 [Telluria sp.]